MSKLEPTRFSDLQAVKRIPTDDGERERLFIETTKQVFLWLADRMEKDDVNQMRSAVHSASRPLMLCEILDLLQPDTARRINATFDALIIEQAAVVGPKILWSMDAQQRVLDWEVEQDGPRKYQNLGDALAARATPKKKAALSDKWKPFRSDLITELKLLQAVLKGRYPESKLPSSADLVGTVIQMITDHMTPYDRLRTNLHAFCLFLDSCKPSAPLVTFVFRGTPTPTMFADEFMAFCSNRDQEALRQAISRMPDP